MRKGKLSVVRCSLSVQADPPSRQPTFAPPRETLAWCYDQVAGGRDPNEVLDQLTEILRAQYETIESECTARRARGHCAACQLPRNCPFRETNEK